LGEEMEFFKKRSTAWCILAIVIIFTGIMGYLKGPQSTVSDIETLPSGVYVQDNANILSDSTERYITQMNNGLSSVIGGEVQVATIDTANGRDLSAVAIDLALDTNLSGNSCVFLIAVDDVDAVIVQGDSLMYAFSDSDLTDILLASYTEEDFSRRDLDAGTRKAFNYLIGMYEDYYGIKVTQRSNIERRIEHDNSSAYISRLVLFLMILLIIIIVLLIITSGRRRRAATTVVGTPGMGSGGYYNNRNRNTTYYVPYYGGRNTYTSTNNRSGSTYTYRTPYTGSSSSSSRSGGFGGSSRGGSFSSGSSRSSYSSGSSRSSFSSGSSRSSSSSGSSRSGGFGGSSRGGSFKH
jgi:uncharacterized membrane protein YgcG